MLYRISLLLLVLLAGTDGLLYALFLRRSRKLWRVLFALPSLVLAVGLVVLVVGEDFTPSRSYTIGLYLLAYLTLTVPKFLFLLPALLGRAFRCLSPGVEQVCIVAGAGLGAVAFGALLYGSVWGWRHFQVKQVAYASPDLPAAFEGYRILQLSDLHLGTLRHHPEVVRRLVELVNAQQADLIVFTGDLVNHRADELDGMDDILSGLQAADGVYSVLGNHDYSPYYRWPSASARADNLRHLQEREVHMGWHLLMNEHVLLHRGGACIALIGVENDGRPPFPQRGDLRKAMRGTEGLFKVLLSHDPTHWRREVLPRSDIQLTLSGHTHAMQCCIGGFTPAAWFYRETRGLYMEGERALYVHVGTGEVMIPFRLGAWPEIAVITLHGKRK